MTRPIATARLLARDAFLVLATLAIALKIMIPAGFMPGVEPRNGLPFALVLCTGEGAKIVEPGGALENRKAGDHDPGTAHDSPCPFAAQGAAAPPPTILATVESQLAVYAQPPVAAARDVMPGRGLAAPPPPPTGPPVVLI